MVYHFNTHVYIDPKSGLEKSVPLINIEEQEKYGWNFIDEIQNLSSNLGYVKNIVENLEALLEGKIDFYEGFGYEMYMIECDKEKANVINTYENNKIEAKIPISEVYELMRDWRDYLIEWNKKNE